MFKRVRQGALALAVLAPAGSTVTARGTTVLLVAELLAVLVIISVVWAAIWTDPDRGKIKLADYASAWITQRPGLRPRTVDLYRWLLRKYVEPHLGGVPLGKLSTRMIREWRATLLANGVSVSVAAKAYRLLRGIMAQSPRFLQVQGVLLTAIVGC